MPGKYRPANGTEGEGFFCRFCYECERDRAFSEGESDDGCEILLRTLIYGYLDPEFPSEWTYDEKGDPTCTAFIPIGGKYPTDRMLEESGQLTIEDAP